MSLRSSIPIALSALTLAGGAIPAPRIEHSGNTFHVAVCERGERAGVARCYAHLVTDRTGNGIRLQTDASGRITGAASPNASPTYVLPAQVRAAYNITGNGSSTTTIAIVDAYAYPQAASDLANFRAWAGLPKCGKGCLTILNEFGGKNIFYPSNAGWDVEQAADLDTVSTLCPNCRILLVQAADASILNLATAVHTAAAKGASVIANSYGGGEGGMNAVESYYNIPGVAVTAGTGDSGYGVSFPASSPHVIAVGGTTLNMNGLARVSETAWSGAGSGCSTVFGEPSWQTPGNANMAVNTLCTMRVLADVSADADPNTGVIFYMSIPGYAPGLYIVGGTSVSNQIIAGIFGERHDSVSYASGVYARSAALNDITSGTNAPPSCGGSYLCVSGPGYDGPTGLGTPNGDTAF